MDRTHDEDIMLKDKWVIFVLVGLCLLFYGTSVLRLSLYENELVLNIFFRGKIYIFAFGGLVVSLLFVLAKESRK